MVLLTVPTTRLDPIQDTPADPQAPLVVLATVDEPPTTRSSVTDIFIYGLK